MKSKIFFVIILVSVIIFPACESSGDTAKEKTRKEGLKKIKKSVRKKHKEDIEELDAEIQRLREEIKTLEQAIEKEKQTSSK